MAGYMHNPRAILTQTSKIPSSTSSSSLSSYPNKNVMNKPSWFFIFLLFSISVLTFFLQWRGSYIDHVNQLPFFVPLDGSSDCATKNSTQSSSPVSPDFKSLKFLSDSTKVSSVSIFMFFFLGFSVYGLIKYLQLFVHIGSLGLTRVGPCYFFEVNRCKHITFLDW